MARGQGKKTTDDLTEEERLELHKKEVAREDKIALSTCKCGKASDFPPNVWKIERIAESTLRDKFGRDRNLNVCRSWLDNSTKEMCFEHTINADETAIKKYPFEEVCKAYGWTSWTMTDDGLALKPKWMKVVEKK